MPWRTPICVIAKQFEYLVARAMRVVKSRTLGGERRVEKRARMKRLQRRLAHSQRPGDPNATACQKGVLQASTCFRSLRILHIRGSVLRASASPVQHRRSGKHGFPSCPQMYWKCSGGAWLTPGRLLPCGPCTASFPHPCARRGHP